MHRVLARLILALLLAAFALPALANGPCHDAPAARVATHHGTHGVPRSDERTAVAHVCIGCIPPASLGSRGPLERRPLAIVIHASDTDTFVAQAGTPPALPPPRRDA